jgi:hypothetical protein
MAVYRCAKFLARHRTGLHVNHSLIKFPHHNTPHTGRASHALRPHAYPPVPRAHSVPPVAPVDLQLQRLPALAVFLFKSFINTIPTPQHTAYIRVLTPTPSRAHLTEPATRLPCSPR